MYLQHRDVDRLEELFRSLRDADAPWLAELRLITSGLDKVLFGAAKPKALPASGARPKRRRRRKGAKR
jgi:hypothetical protein